MMCARLSRNIIGMGDGVCKVIQEHYRHGRYVQGYPGTLDGWEMMCARLSRNIIGMGDGVRKVIQKHWKDRR